MLGGTGNVRETLASVVVEFTGVNKTERRRGIAVTVFAFTPLELRPAKRQVGSLEGEIRIARR